MYSVGEKIVYGENGVCTVIKIAPLEISGASKDKLYYYLAPLIGTGVYYSPVDSGAFMRPVISREEAEALIDAIPGIAPAVCNDSRSYRRWHGRFADRTYLGACNNHHKGTHIHPVYQQIR